MVRHKFKCANRVGHPLEIIALSVCEIIHRVYIPLVAGAVMRVFYDAIHDRIAEVHVGRRHVDARTEHTTSLLKLSRVHSLEKVKILFRRTAAVRAVGTGCGGCAFLCGDLLGSLIIFTARS